MEKVLEKFKNLYKGEERLKRHCLLLLLLFIPSIAGGLSCIMDKDTPKEILFPVLGIAAIILVLSIIPGFFLLGFMVDFFKSRIKSQVGLPNINLDTFMKGLKVFPLHFVWGLYASILALVVFVIPIIAIVIGMTSDSTNGSAMLLSIVVFIVLFIVLYLLLLAVFLVLAPFYNYIYLSFIEDFVYRAEYFNPMTLVYYIKRVFKPTMLVMLKFLLASLILNVASQIVFTIVMLVVSVIAGISLVASGDSDSTLAPAFLVMILPLSTLAALVQSYICIITGLAAGDAYTDIYKEQIRIPDPAETKEETGEQE